MEMDEGGSAAGDCEKMGVRASLIFLRFWTRQENTLGFLTPKIKVLCENQESCLEEAVNEGF